MLNTIEFELNLNGYCIHKRRVVASLCTVLSLFYVYFSVFCKQYMHGFCYIICFGEFTSDIVFILHTCYIYPCNNFATCYNIVIFLLDGTVECTQLSSNDIEEPCALPSSSTIYVYYILGQVC